MRLTNLYSKADQEPGAQELPLGFAEENIGEKYSRNLKTIFLRSHKYLKASGIYNNVWLWNIVFLNLAFAVVIFFLIRHYYPILPEYVGINVDNFENVDLIIEKSKLFFILIVHLLIPIFTFITVLKVRNKLNPLLIISFFNYVVLGVLEIIALRNLLIYFI